MFKVNNLNGDRIETTSSGGNILGSAAHKALEAYFSSTEKDEGETIKKAHETGIEYLKNTSDGFIEYNKNVQNRAHLNERFAFAFFGYIKEFPAREDIKNILLVEKKLKHKIQIGEKLLPVPLTAVADLVYEDHQDRITIWDHKFTSKYSNEDEIDASKLVQAVFNYFTVYAETGRAPYRMVFDEFKIIPNQDKSKQSRIFEIVYEDTPLMFELFYRLYEDITDAMMGKQVYIPNFSAMFDKEVSILAYIHRLDIIEDREQQFKKMKVENITDFLKKKIQKSGAMKKYLDVVSSKFISAKTLNYSTMTTPEKIKAKLAEHGLGVEFEEVIKGASVELYKFEPSIGLKMGRIRNYVDDIEQALGISGIRVLAPIPDSNSIGFEVPLLDRTFPEVPNGKGFDIAIGQTIMGKTRRFDIRQAPHVLVSGSSGSGKSVFLNGMIKQLLTIPFIQLHLFDPKQVELSQFEDERKVVEYESDHAEIRKSLENLVLEMEDRYSKMKKAKVKNISALSDMSYKFIVIDEFADLTMKGSVSSIIQTLAQKGRACGIHIIIATQRASTKVISGDIKVNFPTRIVFKMAKINDSVIMLDEGGAEKLLGKGDCLFLGDKGIERLQGYNS